MHIRRLAPPDQAAIAELLRSDGTFNEGEVSVAMELVESAANRPEGDYQALCCDDGARVLGYVCYGRTPMTEATWDLYWIATHHDARGRGVASRLVAAMEAEVRALYGRTVRIETSQVEAYGAARSFYARLRYAEVGRIPDFYKDGDDLVILAKRIDRVEKHPEASDARVVVPPA
jgi:ribosomal protein S18 acetylase RimI-like enzyme